MQLLLSWRFSYCHLFIQHNCQATPPRKKCERIDILYWMKIYVAMCSN
jgi:hypothetical protein